MSRDSKEKDKLISLLNNLLQWRDPERDRDLVFVQRQPFLSQYRLILARREGLIPSPEH